MVVFSRRQFLSSSPAVFGGTSILSACSHGPDPEGYEAVAARTRRVSSLAGLEGVSLSEQLVRYATLAPSSHNTQAALAHGLKAETSFDATRDAVRVTLAPTPAQTSSLFKAIPLRQCTRSDYDSMPLSSEELGLLEHAGRKVYKPETQELELKTPHLVKKKH